MLLSHRARLLELWRIAATYRIDTHLSVEEAPQLQPVARLIRLHPAAWGKNINPMPLSLRLKTWVPCF
ncbi:hypothetical protein Psyaliredsea_23330 [Psychrobacter alimentarius]